MIIAAQNFGDHPEVLVMITIANTLGIVLLLGLAKILSWDNKKRSIYNKKRMPQPDT